eukprot:SAG31_NODE_12742_length_920_cov_0.725944_1_plen_83_part_01
MFRSARKLTHPSSPPRFPAQRRRSSQMPSSERYELGMHAPVEEVKQSGTAKRHSLGERDAAAAAGAGAGGRDRLGEPAQGRPH